MKNVKKIKRIRPLSARLSRGARHPATLACVPMLCFVAYEIGGESVLLGVACLTSLLLGLMMRGDGGTGQLANRQSGILTRDQMLLWLENVLENAPATDRQVAVMSVSLDDFDALEVRFGRDMRDVVLSEAADRLTAFVRDHDVIAQINGREFALGIMKLRPPETENLLQMSRRLQAAFDDPFSFGPRRTYCSVSIGLAAESHIEEQSAQLLLGAAERAGELAARAGPGSVRIYSEGLDSETTLERNTASLMSNALETGEIFAWFQPQFRASTDEVVGFEALARWDHPEHGLVSPASFLPDIQRAGLSPRLAEVVLKQALAALNAWDAAGFKVATVSVNFSSEELRNPRLPDYVRWELDRYNLDPTRLVIEVLESVVADSSEDVIIRTLISLSRIGCRVDLDDFGTGSTCFLNIHRFNVTRIKIDRCLVSGLDRDEKQYRMVSALLAFSREMGIEALAEGVETPEEVAALKDLACDTIQGYVAARPMPLGETLNWLEEHAPPTPAFKRPQVVRNAG